MAASPTTTLAQRWSRARLDPLSRRLARALRGAARLGMLRDFNVTTLPSIAALVARHGLNTRTVHTLQALQHPERLALVDRRRCLTYAETDAEINKIANGLRRFGVGRKTPVVLMMVNRVEYAAAWFALFRIGAMAVHAPYRATAAELAYQLAHSGARTVLCDDRALTAVLDATKDDAASYNIVAIDAQDLPRHVAPYETFVREADAQRPPAADGESESANIVYTSGTTGKPKGAVRDFGKVGAADFFRIVERMPVHVGDRHLVISPLYHSAGQVFTMLQATLGATTYFMDHFDPAEVLRTLSRERINTVFMVPTMIHRLLDLPELLHQECSTPDLRLVISGAGAFPDGLRRRAIERFGPDVVWDFYGATELGWITLLNGNEMLQKPGSVGRPLPGIEIKILDEQRQPLPPGEVGMVYVRNEQTMVGYLHNDEATRESVYEDFMTVDDLGYLDEDGYLFLGGRARDMVISGGVNIYPKETEEVVSRHPDVGEVAVIGVPDEEWGERLVAYVAPSGDRFDPEALTSYAREHLAGYKVPREWYRIDALPRNPTGKVLKRQLREQYLEQTEAQG